LAVVAVGVAGLVFGEQAARGGLARELDSIVGHPAAMAIEELIKNVSVSGEGRWATIVGVLVLLFGASTLFVQMQDALNTIWKVAARPGRSVWTAFRDRILSFGVVLITGVLLLASLVVSGVFASFLQWFPAGSLVGGTVLWILVNQAVSFVLITVMLALVYKILPDVQIAWRDVWVGAMVSAALLTGGKYLLALYLSHSGMSSAFGAAASLVVLLIWVYYSAQILLFGAEVVRAGIKQRGAVIRPTENAEFIPCPPDVGHAVAHR
jgi:membrane protein